MTVKLDIPALVDDCTRAAAYIETREPALGSEAYRYADVFRQAASALTAALEIGRAMGRAELAAEVEAALPEFESTAVMNEFYRDRCINTKEYEETAAELNEARATFLGVVRSTPSAVDAEDIAQEIQEKIEEIGQMWTVQEVVRMTLSSLGLHAREN